MEYPSSKKHANKGYTDYILAAPSPHAVSAWNHNLMKLVPAGSNKIVDPRQWSQPVYLNRRDEYSIKTAEQRAAEQAANLEKTKQRYGAVVVGSTSKLSKERAAAAENSDAEQQMAARDEKLVAPAPPLSASTSKTASGSGKDVKQKSSNASSSRFQKKTTRVYQTEASAIARKIQREERFPWLLQDSNSASPSADGSQSQRWMGKVEGGSANLGGVDDGATGGTSATKGGNYMLFLLDDSSATASNEPTMKVLPVHRWYKFLPKPLVKTGGAAGSGTTAANGVVLNGGDEAEKEFARRAKSKSEDRWGVRNRRLEAAAASGSGAGSSRGNSPFSSNRGRVKKEEDLAPVRSFQAVHGQRSSAKPSARRRGRGDQDDEYDEFDYDEEFQDDEEGAGGYEDDAAGLDEDQAKELEERIKKDQRGAIHFADDVQPVQDDVEMDDDLFGDRELDRQGRQAKKLLKKHEKRPEYDSDDDEMDNKNPYLSESEMNSSEDEPASASGSATKQRSVNAPASTSKSPLTAIPPSLSASRPKSKPPSLKSSRSGSPIPQSPATAAGAMLAKRATSPKPSTPRARSPASSRAGSPVASSGMKRKASEQPDAGTESEGGGNKKARVAVSEEVKQILNEDVVVRFVRDAKTPADATAKNLLKFVKSKLKIDPRGPGVSDHLQGLIRKRLTLTDGVFTVKE